MHKQVNVLLPPRIFKEAGDDKAELKRLIVNYMTRYPNYRILKVKDGFAVCEMN